MGFRHRTRKEKEEAENTLIAIGNLSDMYSLSSASKGRQHPDRQSTWRTCYERDVDRIIYSMAYRRLRNKTQVFMFPSEQHITTRLMHTEEVYQVARGVCSFLGLNQTLAEAIARGHDLGHTPFGHTGEEELEMVMQEILGDDSYTFHHAKYGLDIVDRIEKDGKGLNLTHEVRDGIAKHSLGKERSKDPKYWPETVEGRVVFWSDKIAYTCSDMDDALRVGALNESDLPQAELRLLGPRKSKWIGSLNKALVETSLAYGDVNNDSFSGEYRDAFDTIKDFMYRNVYGGKTGDPDDPLKKEFKKARKQIRLVFEHVMETRFSDLEQKDAAHKTLDVVACMTDQSIMRYFKENFQPKAIY